MSKSSLNGVLNGCLTFYFQVHALYIQISVSIFFLLKNTNHDGKYSITIYSVLYIYFAFFHFFFFLLSYTNHFTYLLFNFVHNLINWKDIILFMYLRRRAAPLFCLTFSLFPLYMVACWQKKFYLKPSFLSNQRFESYIHHASLQVW